MLVEDRLFSTLDPTTRRLRLPGGETVLLTDTVGFVRRLPHQLVEAFRSTLEEVGRRRPRSCTSSTPSAPDAEAQIDAVHDVLDEIGADEVPELLVVNKIDDRRAGVIDDLLAAHPASSRSRPRTGDGIDDCSTRSAAGCARCRRSSSCSSRTNAATCSPRSTARARSSSRCTTTPETRVAGPPPRGGGRRVSPSSSRLTVLATA